MSHRDSRRTTTSPHLAALKPAVLAVAMGCLNTAWAVEGGAVVAGNGSIATQGGLTTITQSSDKMVVNWNSFDIARDQRVDIRQPAATSAVLNRVTGARPTEILGSLNANGRVFVVNPNGVLFGRTAKVDVGGLVASTLDTSPRDFMEGGRLYKGLSAPQGQGARYVMLEGGGNGPVRNEGRINARESVVLAGPHVVNQGTIRARDVVLQAGGGVGVKLDGSGFYVVPSRGSLGALAANEGAIVADGGNIALSAAATGDMLRDVVRNTGTLEATRAVAGEGGHIELSAPLDGAIRIGGKVSGASVAAYASPGIAIGDASMPQLEQDTALSPTGHDVRVDAGARLTSSGSVALGAENDIGVGGRIDAGSVYVSGRNVSTQAPIHAAGNVNITAYGGRIVQDGNITTDRAHVLLQGRSIQQGANTTTRAGDYIKLEAANTSGGTIAAAHLQGRRVEISGHDIVLDGNVRGDDDVRVTAIDERGCGEICTAEFRQGSIVQNGRVASRNGNVMLSGLTLNKWMDTNAVTIGSGVITQSATARTVAAGDVKVMGSKVRVGNVQAGRSIMVKAVDTEITGRLVAPEIILPADARNTEGNVRIKR